MTSLDQFKAITDSPEGSHIEFKFSAGGSNFKNHVSIEARGKVA